LNNGNGLKNATGDGYETGWVVSDNGNIAPEDVNLACEPPYDTWTSSLGSHEDLPIDCANWWEAYAFCIWDGGFLPSNAEWQHAATGGSQRRQYPWGSTDPGTANQYAISNCNYPSGSRMCSGIANIAPVGTATLGTGRWGQLDLVGEVWEWNLDWSHGSYFDHPKPPCTDCADLTTAAIRLFRGGDFSGPQFLEPTPLVYDGTFRGSALRGSPLGTVGFRCARSP
jgi:formylglycine-generating enzyme required for sulfatase activity